MDTVLGLAITPSTIGWVIADSGGPGCPTIDGEEVRVADGPAGPAGSDATALAEQAGAVAAQVCSMLATRGERLHGVAVTWSDDAAVGVALLLETLADAGVEHVVPVRYSQAAEALAAGIGSRGSRPAVCIVETDVATLVMPDPAGGASTFVTTCPISGIDDVVGWLGDAVRAGDRRPDAVMVAGSVRGMDRLGRRLESTLSMPVFVQGGALQALARGAALALAPHAELTAAPSDAPAGSLGAGAIGRLRARPLSYVAALLALAGAVVTLVASVAAALSLQLGPSRDLPDPPPHRATVARVAVPAAPSAAAPAPAPPPAVTAPPAETPENTPDEFGSLWDAPEDDPGLVAPAPAGVSSQLERIRDHIFGQPGR
ncbi:hypothetical protein BST33_04115 [Mycolicibacter minnesotensis]|uniref:DUF7159 domain-containing protein n=1 Tax=Mycolicibacter minnesotensis TaxID=1118379 RepID=A0AA91RN18_9MYCO|nr:hypothetical protein [Mycolicibacter minnesotensis]ORB03141.1 hypothetical protein BST33_04115 [Mycolicibacter minnesotensis]